MEDSEYERTLNLKEEIRALEELRLRDALEQTGGHQRRAAELLGLSYNQFRGLYRRMNPGSLGL
jgi:psp operon transcriptional activator